MTTSQKTPFVYLVMTLGILLGRYSAINFDISSTLIFSLTKSKIRKSISIAATPYTNDGKSLKKNITSAINTINIIKSQFILLSPRINFTTNTDKFQPF